MSYRTFGQVNAVQPQPIVRIPPEVYQAMGTFWNTTIQQCEKVLTPAQCRQMFGFRMSLIPQTTEAPGGIKWYVWFLVGLGVGKVIL